MISPEHLIRWLRDDDDVADAVGTVTLRGHTATPIISELPSVLAEVMPRRAIVVTSAGGPEVPGSHHDIVTGRQDVRCYGRTVADAWALHNVVYKALRYGGRRDLEGITAYGVSPTAGGAQSREPDGGWPYVWTEYTIRGSERRAA